MDEWIAPVNADVAPARQLNCVSVPQAVPPAQDCTRRALAYDSARDEGAVLFSPLHHTKDKRGKDKPHGGYKLYLTDIPGHFIVSGPPEWVPSQQEFCSPTYEVHAFLPAEEGEYRDEGGTDWCACKAFWLWGVCKHVVGVHVERLKAERLLNAMKPPIYESAVRRINDHV